MWRGRFYSCPLDEDHLWLTLRYAEFNPVRAGLVNTAELWPRSSAAAHCGSGVADADVQMAKWAKRCSSASWKEYLDHGESDPEIAAIRKCTHTGRPLGTVGFLRELEQATLRQLIPKKGGPATS